MSLERISQKARRAIRNKTGTTYSPEQIRELAGAGFLHLMSLLEADELCREAGVEPAVYRSSQQTRGGHEPQIW